MNLENVRSLRDAFPFHPFTIHMADGRSLRIPHRDFISVSPGGRTVIVYHSDEAFSFVDLLLVTQVSVEGQPAGTTPAAGDAA